MKSAELLRLEIFDVAKSKIYPGLESPKHATIDLIRQFESDARKDERQKIATEVRAMTLDQITDAETISKSILRG